MQKNLALNELRDLHFTLATTFNALKDYDAAFRHYEAGNRFRAMSLGPPFSIENVRKTWCGFANTLPGICLSGSGAKFRQQKAGVYRRDAAFRDDVA